MLWGLYSLGFDWEANDFFYFIADVAEAEPDRLQIMYGIGGEAELAEQTLDHLSGYEGARPVRIGNGAYDQDQHDVWGRCWTRCTCTRSRVTICPSGCRPILKGRWMRAARSGGPRPRPLGDPRLPEPIISPRRSYCWVAVRPGRAAGRDPRRVRPGGAVAAGWRTRSSRHLREDPRARCLFLAFRHRRARRLGPAHAVDVLPSDRRRALLRTVRAIRTSSPKTGWSCATGSTRQTTGWRARRGTFTICLALARVGAGRDRRPQAAAPCARSFSYSSPLGLYAEELDPRTRAATSGNFHQAFTHLALINAVMHVIRADQGLEAGPYRSTRTNQAN